NRPPQPRTPGLACQPPPTVPGLAPVQRKPQKVVGRRTPASLLPFSRSVERQQSSLVRMKVQPAALHPLAQHSHHALRILPMFKADDKVIGVADQARPPFQAGTNLSLEPPVEYVVQIDVAQQRGEDSS